MFKLPDYSKCINLTQLLSQMGVKEVIVFTLPPIQFTTSKIETVVKTVINPQLEFAEKMQTQSIPLNNGTFTIAEDGTLELDGVKCSIYIKNQRSGIDSYNKTSTYRYHLSNCKTIQHMYTVGRYSRYVATSRSDGLFAVNNQMFDKASEMILKLELCQNCRENLINSGMYETPFKLENFFKKYQTRFTKTVQREEQVLLKTQYAPNHTQRAQRYKEEANYKCQQCEVSCIENKYLLHLHHKDGDGQNNSHSNLLVLCVDCHSKQPMHTQLLRTSKYKEQVDLINNLRKKQKIHIITSE